MVVAIIAILVGLTLFGATAAHKHFKKTTARQQLDLIANAIEQYASFWPRWEVRDPNFGRVVIAEKGWPDFIPGRLFAPTNIGGRFALTADPDNTVFNAHITFTLRAGDANSGISYNTEGNEDIDKGDVEAGSETLLYCLTAKAGDGPFMADDTMEGDLQIAHEDEFYPGRNGPSINKRGEFRDPWGNPYRYFWIYRDPTPPSSNARAINGFLPVDYGAFKNSVGTPGGRISNPLFLDSNNQPKTAVGFVIESAGPDGNFGNIWQPRDSVRDQREIDDAEDNLIKRVP